jgi:hypothetical protein
MNNNEIYLDYDPKYQGIVKTAAYLWFVCFAIFMLQVVLLINNLKLFNYASTGDWNNFLQLLNTNANQFALIKVGFLALRTIYVITCLGYIVAVWKINPSAALSFLGFTLVTLPVILVVQVFQLALVPLAHEYVSALAVSGVTEAIKSAYLVSANILYTMTDMGDTFVALVLFNAMFIAWLFIAFQKTASQMVGLVDYCFGALAFRQSYWSAYPRFSQRNPNRAFLCRHGIFNAALRAASEKRIQLNVSV